MMTTAFTHGSLTILGIQMILGFFDPALTAATLTRAQAEAGVRTAQYASKNLYTRMVDMFKSLYVGAKDFFITIKTKIQEGRLLRLLESKPEKALEYIKEHVSLFVRGTREATGNYRPLFNVKFAKGGIRGQFANGTDFLNALAKEFQAMPTDEVFRSISSSSLTNMAARKKMEAFYKELLKTDVYGH
ncbi:MAG: hypothetical protein MJ200_05870 [Mycoplasmoidaceae bacterium]|nr:hypothetical protein [Mycoplasmoidaceae bacterium]